MVRQDPTWPLGVCPTAEPLGAGVSTGVLGELSADIWTSAQGPRATTQASDQLSSRDPRGEPKGTGFGPDSALPLPL